ncbi:hypothetical protein chiPu_0022142, partial [Chiloscyllium punctatum]|nr:hypothetical protein [Chiloscyllium punctatum]
MRDWSGCAGERVRGKEYVVQCVREGESERVYER